MAPWERLARDHGVLRDKLSVLESALQMGSGCWLVLRQVSFSLSKQLRDHSRLETRLAALCGRTLGRCDEETLSALALDHQQEHQRLRVVNWLLRGGESAEAFPAVVSAMTGLIALLRASMEQQQAQLLPLVRRVLFPQDAPAKPSGRLRETMVVSDILCRYPRTRQVFEQLRIQLPLEQYDALDEVAWRHGMDSGALVGWLEREIAGWSGWTRPLPPRR